MVSIIVPIYNTSKYLPECINSIFYQTYTDWELILVDDGSIDDSYAVAQQLISDRANCHLYKQPNSGPSVARNNGIYKSTGEYILFVDSDDIIEPTHIESFMKYSQYDIVWQGLTSYMDGETIPMEVKTMPCMQADNEDSLKKMTLEIANNQLFGWSVTKLYKRHIIDEYDIRFNEGLRMHEDELFALEYLLHCKNGVLTDVATYHYRYRSSSLQRTKKESDFGVYKYMCACMEELREAYKSKWGSDSAYDKIMRDNYCHLVRVMYEPEAEISRKERMQYLHMVHKNNYYPKFFVVSPLTTDILRTIKKHL